VQANGVNLLRENIIYSKEKHRNFVRTIKRIGTEVNATDT